MMEDTNQSVTRQAQNFKRNVGCSHKGQSMSCVSGKSAVLRKWTVTVTVSVSVPSFNNIHPSLLNYVTVT